MFKTTWNRKLPFTDVLYVKKKGKPAPLTLNNSPPLSAVKGGRNEYNAILLPTEIGEQYIQ
jgi:hypothetical protein